MATTAEATDRLAVTLASFADSARGVLSRRPTYLVSIVDELIDFVDAHEVAIRVTPSKDGSAFVVEASNNDVVRIEDPRAKGIVRSMCANLSVRTGEERAIYGGQGEFDVSDGKPPRRIFARWVNTPSEQAFELSSIATPPVTAPDNPATDSRWHKPSLAS